MEQVTTNGVRLVGVTGHLEPVHGELVADRRAGIIVLGPDGRRMPETRDRLYAGITNSRWDVTRSPVRVSLPPSHEPSPGSATDLAFAAAILILNGVFRATALDGVVLVGELGLDGAIRPVRGALPMVAAAARAGLGTVVVPAANAHEAGLVPGVQFVPVDSLRQFVLWASFGIIPELPGPDAGPAQPTGGGPILDLADLPAGMARERWALEVAAAGGHHLGLLGPLGSGKTVLAERLPSLLPDLGDNDAVDVTALRSAAGLLHPADALVRRPPFIAPHHSASLPSLIGGGPRAPRPGAISLAHRGVFYMDQTPEFGHRVLTALRQPVDQGQVTLAGGSASVTYPARTQMVLAAQSCPCGRSSDVESRCGCSPRDRVRYLARMSALWERTDIRLSLEIPASRDGDAGESSAVVAARVAAARERAADRWAALGYRVNALVPGEVLRTGVCALPTCDINPLLELFRVGTVSDDGYDRVLRVAWTVADLRAADRPDRDDVTAAIELHLDRQPTPPRAQR
ncbi:ATP-binding protein [Actinoplanes sp. NPDC089786]|uniref:ATP-binding protein n=1 Tax=Actinoplanes sp. NPDC089786 TaxID=3155185 RepID=UPI003448F020